MSTTFEPATEPRPIMEVAHGAGLEDAEVIPYGNYRAKIRLGALDRLKERPQGKLVVVTGMTPTRFGEGKTTTAIGLAMGLGRIGARSMLCLREPSMGPLFGIKGGGTGGGMAQLYPMEDINLHFNGDFHAITAAHNLLAAAVDASIFNDNPLGIVASSIRWPRALDVDDRALRHVVIGLGGAAHGVPREAGFVITAASEIMAVLALSRDLRDLRIRLGRIAVAERKDGTLVTAEDLGVAGAMTVIMKDALMPNLVQTLEGQPALVHAGPFGNIAHGANSLIADRMGLGLGDIVLTEAGFGSDLGMEKFCDIVCQLGDLQPTAAVLVATVRAVKAHGSSDHESIDGENLGALERGFANLAAHIENVHTFGLRCLVAVNLYPTDTDKELHMLEELALRAGAEAVAMNDGYGQGGAGAEDAARALQALVAEPSNFKPLNPLGTPITEQIERLATRVYGAARAELLPQARKDLAWLKARGLDTLPVCMAKSNLSLSHDPNLKGRPTGYTLPVRELKPSLGAGFVVALTGDINLMPGFGREPAYKRIDIDDEGRTVGLT